MTAPSRGGVGGVLGGLLGFLGVSTIAGVLAAAVLVPAVAVGGITANTGASIFNGVSEYIDPGTLAEPSTIWAYDGKKRVKLAQFYYQNRKSVSLKRMSPYVVQAAVAAEDERFYEHQGVDLIGLARSAASIASGQELQGGSTITMQYVRNIKVLEAVQKNDPDALDDATDVTVERKLTEIKQAMYLEDNFEKDEILQGYLNSINFGNVYGVEAAAQKYFNVSAKNLTLPQAASLIAIVQRPEDLRLDYKDNRERNKTRRDAILFNMKRLGYITPQQYDKAVATKIKTNLTSNPSGCQYAYKSTGFFCEYVRYEIEHTKNPALGKNAKERAQTLLSGGLQIYTTIDLRLQDVADRNIKAWAPADFEPIYLGGTVSTVEPGTGRILVMAQNRPYDATVRNPVSRKSTSISYNGNLANGGSSGFQPGSTFKIFTLAQWLRDGKSLDSRVNGTVRIFDPADFSDRCYGTGGPPIRIGNASESPPSVDIVRATYNSINTAYLSMAQQLDLCDIRETAEDMGVTRADGRPWSPGFSMVIGSEEVSPMDMANAFATASADGVHCELTSIDSISQRIDGSLEQLDWDSRDCDQAIPPDVARGIAYTMKHGLTMGTVTPANPGNGMPVFGKTGTTSEQHGSWVAVATPKAATTVWIGNVVGHMQLAPYSVNGQNLYMSTRFIVAKEMLLKIADLYGFGQDWPAPPSGMLHGKPATVPDVTGLTVAEATKNLETNGFSVSLSDTGRISVLPKNQIAAQEPSAGSKVAAGSQVTIFKSNGNGVVAPEQVGLRVQQAIDALVSAGFSPDRIDVDYVHSDERRDVVVRTNTPAGQVFGAGRHVTLTVSDGPGKGGGG